MAESLIHLVGGGLVGSGVTYGLSWWRERKRMKDAYRAPQREAIGGIIAAANELDIAGFTFRDLAIQVAKYLRDDSGDTEELRFAPQDLPTSQQMFDRAAKGLEYAFQVGRLTIVDAACYEKMGAAHNAYCQIRDAFNAAIEAVPYDGDGEKKPDDLDAARRHMYRYASQLAKDIDELVLIADDRVSPVQSLWNQLQRRAIRKRREAEFFNQAAGQGRHAAKATGDDQPKSDSA